MPGVLEGVALHIEVRTWRELDVVGGREARDPPECAHGRMIERDIDPVVEVASDGEGPVGLGVGVRLALADVVAGLAHIVDGAGGGEEGGRDQRRYRRHRRHRAK